MAPLQWQSFIEAIGHRLKTSRLIDDLKIKIRRENELMAYFLTDPDIIKLLSIWLEETYVKREGKSMEKATIFRLLGNKEFQSKNYADSLESYTKSVIFAPSSSEDRAVAIGNRSAALFYLEKYEDCIKDIELAISLKYPEKLCYKLYMRAVQCYLKLGKKEFARSALHRVRDLLADDDMPNTKKEKLKKQLTQLASVISVMKEAEDTATENAESRLQPELAFGENTNFPSASTGVEIKHTPHKGRHVVANRDIKRGQTLFIEKPFTFVIIDENNVCEHCCRSLGDTPLPCSECVGALFCTENCLNEGYELYHRWDCPGNRMGLWQQIGIAHLALKVFLMCTNTTDNIMFNKVQQLTTNFNDLATNDLIIYGITAAMLTLYLSKYTDYFKVFDVREHLASKFSDNTFNFNNDLTSNEDERMYVSSLLLRHILQLISNGHAITKINTIASDTDKLCVEQQDRIATAIYPSTSMMNHSCDPNVINSFMDQYIIIKATKDIATGEEIFNCYGPHFRRMSTEERQEILKSQYCFTCRCEPCVMPEYQNFLDRFTAMKCPECSGALQDFQNYSMHCLDCGATPIINCQTELKRALSAFEAAQIYVDLEKEEEALVKFKECLSIRRAVLYKYHEDVTTTLDCIGRVYALMGRWFDSISHLEHSLAAIEERYGSSSIEFANELNKLTDICLNYLRTEPNRATKWYKNILKKTRRYLDRAEEIININYGPWNNACSDIAEKKKALSFILKDFNI